MEEGHLMVDHVHIVACRRGPRSDSSDREGSPREHLRGHVAVAGAKGSPCVHMPGVPPQRGDFTGHVGKALPESVLRC